MRKTLNIFIILFLTTLSQAQTNTAYQFKAEYIYGSILKHTVHLENLVKDPVQGAELAIEWKTMGEKPWHQYYNFPTLGIGLVGLDLGNPEMLGQLLAIYPYMNLKLINTGFFKLNLKAGVGASFLNKRYNNTPHLENTLSSPNGELNQANAAIGSILNIYFAGGGNMEVPLFSGLSLVAAYNWNHASNGSFFQPNSGINMLNASVGFTYFPSFKTYIAPQKKGTSSLPQKFSFDVIVSGGARELYYKDDKMYPIASLAFGAYRQLGNNLRLGMGIDGFYDGVYNGNTMFKRTFLTTDELKNKIRVGLSLRPELVFGKLSAGMHFGLYLYNPLKNLEPCDSQGELINSTQKKPLIYSYNIDNEDGWFYTRASLKYAFSKHYFISLGLKTHLQKAEFIEWGLGYRL
ncbi:MAG: acyloxyacyl hydrolase [Paludibacter sp.]|nr:acyloxyacyl hydrolase [Paludibacter sp.]